MSNIAIDTSSSTVSQWVTFFIENEKYAIDVMQVQEIIRPLELSPVPGAPDYVLGIINLRGIVVSIIDTRKRFNLPEREMTEQARIIIIESGGNSIGILVDSVADVANLNEAEIEDAPNVGSNENSKYIDGVYHQNDHLLILVNVQELLSEEEWAEMSEWAKY